MDFGFIVVALVLLAIVIFNIVGDVVRNRIYLSVAIYCIERYKARRYNNYVKPCVLDYLESWKKLEKNP